MIASIYIEEHSYLTDKPLTLNFGGEYLYSFKEIGESLIISREKNEKYIPNFFNISKSVSKIELLSAIVGENGVGKSSILDIIRSIFSNLNSFTHNKVVVLVEIEGKTKVLSSTTSHKYYLEENSFNEIEQINESKSYQSIYYSPHFDLKYNPNYDELDKYDISLDEYIKEDLDEIDRKGTNERGWKYKLHQELKFKNTLRIIEFMDSIPFKKISEHFKLSGYDKVDLIFRDLLSDDNFWNTPSQFRGIITQIKEKLEEERRDWYTIRIFDENHNVKNQDEVNKYLLKNFIIGSILSVICRILEEDAGNFYLEEGYIEKEELFTNRKLNAEQLFLLFLENAYTNIGEKKKIFDEILYYELFNKIGKVLLPISNPRDVTNQIIHTKLNDIKPIIDLHRKCVRNLVAYFKENEDKNLNLYEFISINAYRNMSSGEFAILNFFSKLYFFLKNKPTTLLDKKNFILLLDEADLGLHPMWKKRFINTILKSIPYFFEELTPKPNLQIILTTHDPLTLSDIPKHNVIFLEKPEGKCQISSRVQKTFGANITDLLADSFFLEKGLIGDFARKKINDVINWINENRNKTEINEEELERYQKVIELIDERVIKLKLSEMITELLPDNTFYNKVIDDEIKRLENLKKLKNDTNRYY
jgi:hypothetical protein